MKKLPVTLFFLGIVIDLAAMFGEHAAEIPFVLKHLCPSYWRAQQAMDKLLHEPFLRVSGNVVGFKEIEDILLKQFRNESLQQLNIPTNIIDVHIVEMKIHPLMEIKDEPVKDTATIDIVMYNPGLGKFDDGHLVALSFDNFYSYLKLENEVEKLKEPNILFFCFGMFFIGSTIAIFAFFLEAKESNSPTENQPQQCPTIKSKEANAPNTPNT
jgi:hypothetical protein